MCFRQKEVLIKNIKDSNLSEAYFYYGLMAHSRGELTKLHEVLCILVLLKMLLKML
jgi:hypothetical protein